MVFFGTSAFAVPALESLVAHGAVALVVTQPDRPSGRGQRMHPTDVKVAALTLGVPVIEPIRPVDAAERLAAVRPDLLVVASYGRIIPQRILDCPRLGALNVHPSLLPLYRGATPLQTAIRDGVDESGVSIILMDAGMDTGDVVVQERTAVRDDETFGELHDRYARLGADLVVRAVGEAEAGTLVRTPQHTLGISQARIDATLTRPLSRDDLLVDWLWPAQRVARTVRSLSPRPLARATIAGEALKVVSAHVARPGEREHAASIVCGDGEALVLDAVVPPNRSPMSGDVYFARSRASG